MPGRPQSLRSGPFFLNGRIPVDSHQEYVLREVAQKNIRFIRLWFTDVAGVLKSISIRPR